MLDNGSILEIGSYDELIARKGAFFNHLDKQIHDNLDDYEKYEEKKEEPIK